MSEVIPISGAATDSTAFVEDDDHGENAGVIDVSLETAVADRLAALTDALLGTPKVADHLLPLVRNHLVAATDAVVPKSREHLSTLEIITAFTTRVRVLLSTPPPLTTWLMVRESRLILLEDPEALHIWPKPTATLQKCVRDVLSDRNIARPTCVRVLSDSALLGALEQADATGEDYVARRIAEHILKGDKVSRRAARLYAQRYGDQLGRNRFLRGLSLVLRGYWAWTFIRSVVPIVIDLGVLFGVVSTGLPVMFAAQTCFRRITTVVNFSFKHFCAFTAL
ncbi:unnamed protein product [Peniophora sp. CBMAI 1063]|nr:unnamed protein product [Peniophora sp. CBMAI 1063]